MLCVLLAAALVTLSLDEKYRRVRVAGTNKVNDTVDADLRLGEWKCSDYKVEILVSEVTVYNAPTDINSPFPWRPYPPVAMVTTRSGHKIHGRVQSQHHNSKDYSAILFN